MNTYEKLELLKPTIFQLYSKEGRSKVYIAKLLEVNRKKLTEKIKEWGLPTPAPMRHLNPSNQKFLNKNRSLIKSRLDCNFSIKEISEELGVTKSFLCDRIICNDEILTKSYQDYLKRKTEYHEEKLNDVSRIYPDEEWKEIPNYENYFVSNYGRVKIRREETLKGDIKEYILKIFFNQINGKLYVTLLKDYKKKNLQVARLVGFAFVDGYSKETSTIRHKDGNKQNNYYKNLEWTKEEKKKSVKNSSRKKIRFKKLIYKDQFEFKTLLAFSRFLNISEESAEKFLEEPEKYHIKLIV